MVRDAAGRFGTWGGVGYDRWHHGRSGVGTAQLDAVRSEVAVYALGELRADGQLVAAGLPLHAHTTGAGVELHVGDPATLVPALPDVENFTRRYWTPTTSRTCLVNGRRRSLRPNATYGRCAL